MLCENSTGYLFCLIIYSDVDTDYPPWSVDLLKSFHDYPNPSDKVLSSAEGLYRKGYCIIVDNLYATPELLLALYINNANCYGTLWPRKGGFCFWKSGGWKIFYHSPARIAECVWEYIFLISKNKQKKKKEKEKKKEYKKATETIEEKIIFPGNRLKRSKFADAQVKIFLVARLSRNKSNFFWSQEKERPYEIFLVLKTLKKLGWNQSKCFLNKSLW